MNLVVYSKESLDKIESSVLSKFQEIKSIDRKPPSFPGQPCTSEHLQAYYNWAIPISVRAKMLI
ncbi:insulinase (Peptidase family M16) family protein [Artemisia annua]|uniref:Insulinase (Peptidase family M16) family protein n=1 Tax=Artemisia annua TaxID=35608 RepID=A0A2U1M5Q6_ARTAN|nr:insulinase (Peptidase family M16) family protein [Artemisia annua]